MARLKLSVFCTFLLLYTSNNAFAECSVSGTTRSCNSGYYAESATDSYCHACPTEGLISQRGGGMAKPLSLTISNAQMSSAPHRFKESCYMYGDDSYTDTKGTFYYTSGEDCYWTGS
ncbi:MAG: hypothetical protein IJ866_01995 [Alphaproteobacteria bacterium]|nr:hypothetical protein [Alphaproteobacteria bacterium]